MLPFAGGFLVQLCPIRHNSKTGQYVGRQIKRVSASFAARDGGRDQDPADKRCLRLTGFDTSLLGPVLFGIYALCCADQGIHFMDHSRARAKRTIPSDWRTWGKEERGALL